MFALRTCFSSFCFCFLTGDIIFSWNDETSFSGEAENAAELYFDGITMLIFFSMFLMDFSPLRQ